MKSLQNFCPEKLTPGSSSTITIKLSFYPQKAHLGQHSMYNQFGSIGN